MNVLLKLCHYLIARPLKTLPWEWTTRFHNWTCLWAFEPEVVCILYIDYGDRLLGVSRRGTTDQWGLPGGKVEAGEKPEAAAVREMFEETLAVPIGLKPIYRGWSRQHKIVQVYTAEGLTCEPSQGDAGLVEFITWKELLEGPFGSFHQNLQQRWMQERDY